MNTQNTCDFRLIATSFAEKLISGDFNGAHAMLGKELKNVFHPDDIRQDYESMVDYGDGPVLKLEVMQSMEDWPSKLSSDLGWAYVSLSGKNYLEAVAVIVAKENDKAIIREIEWGRP